jgi:hypothetical protein
MRGGHRRHDREGTGYSMSRRGSTDPESEKARRDKTVSQNSEGIVAPQHAGAVQGGELDQRQLQPQTKPKPRLQLIKQSEQQHEPKPKPTPTPARRSKMVQPHTQSLRIHGDPGPAPTSGLSMA